MAAAGAPRVLYVANEPVWPVRSGGTARMAALIDALAPSTELTVAEARQGGPRPYRDQVRVHGRDQVRGPGVARPRSGWRRPWRAVGPVPLAGTGALGAAAVPALAGLVVDAAPDVVVWSHSYLPAVAPVDVPEIVDFPNIE